MLTKKMLESVSTGPSTGPLPLASTGPSTVQYCTVPYSTVQYCTVLYGTGQLSGRRLLTRDSRNRRLTRDSRLPDFSRKKIRKNRKHRFFGFPGPKSNFELCIVFFYDQYFRYKALFPSSQPSKPLKSSPLYQNLSGDPVTAHSDDQGPISDPI